MAPLPLTRYSDEQLQQAMLLLHLSCGRSRSTYRRKRQEMFCFLFQTIKVEADLRGVPQLPANTGASGLKPDVLAL